MNDKMQPPFISIVIPARNAQRTLKDCLDSLEQLNYPKERLEILLVDGFSTEFRFEQKGSQIIQERNPNESHYPYRRQRHTLPPPHLHFP